MTSTSNGTYTNIRITKTNISSLNCSSGITLEINEPLQIKWNSRNQAGEVIS